MIAEAWRAQAVAVAEDRCEEGRRKKENAVTAIFSTFSKLLTASAFAMFTFLDALLPEGFLVPERRGFSTIFKAAMHCFRPKLGLSL
jgi:hypothetical protein